VVFLAIHMKINVIGSPMKKTVPFMLVLTGLTLTVQVCEADPSPIQPTPTIRIDPTPQNEIAPLPTVTDGPSAVPPAAVMPETGKTTESERPEEESPERGFEEIAGGIDLPARNWQSAYKQGGGGRISEGCKFQDGWAIQLDLELFGFSGTNWAGTISDGEFLVLPTLRYYFIPPGPSPYVLVGAGVDVESSYSTAGNVTVENPDLALGLGLALPLIDRFSLFVEARYNFIFANGTIGGDIPLLLGGHVNF
jgi:hypothetical protein